jgi:hypothetical protein
VINAKNFNRQHKRAAIKDMLLELALPFTGNLDRRTIRRMMSTKGKGKFLKEFIALKEGKREKSV